MEDLDEDVLFENHLLKLCAALGGKELTEYVLGDEAIECLRDLKRFLRRDEVAKDRSSHELLGKWNIVTSDILPILLKAVRMDNMKLALAACEVLVPLTWPVEEKNRNDVENLWQYKRAFSQKGVWKAVLKVIIHLLAIPANKRSENDRTRIQLLISLIRNVVAIEDQRDNLNSSKSTYYFATASEDLFDRLREEEVLEFLLSFAASSSDLEYRPYAGLIMQIFYHLFQGRSIDAIMGKNVYKSDLGMLLEKERLSKKSSSNRHAQFGGTFSISTLGGKRVNLRKVPTADSISFDVGKKSHKIIRKDAIQDLYFEKSFVKPHSANNYKELLQKFVTNCVNDLMPAVKREFDTQLTDIKGENYSQFLFLLSLLIDYFLATKTDDNDFDLITGIINDRIARFIFNQLYKSRDEKQYKNMFFAVKAMLSFLKLLQAMDNSTIEALKQASLHIQSKVFYEQEYIHMLVSLVKDKKPRSVKFMNLAIEVIDTLFLLLEKNPILVTRKKKQQNDEDSDEEVILETESSFSVKRLEFHFGFESVIEYYCYVLEDFENLNETNIDCIVRMFNRISSTERCNKEPLFYKASFLYLFEKIISSSITRHPKYEKLCAFIKVVSKSCVKRINDQPGLIVELFFPKSRSDCIRILNGSETQQVVLQGEEEDAALTEEQLIEQFEEPNSDNEYFELTRLRGLQIRKLSGIIGADPYGAEFIKWLAKSMRQIYYDDIDEVVTEEQKRSGLLTSYFVQYSETPTSVEEYIKEKKAKMILKLIGFDPLGESDWYFPNNFDIELIEHVERAKLFAKRNYKPATLQKQSNLTKFVSDSENDDVPVEQGKIESQMSQRRKKLQKSTDFFDDAPARKDDHVSDSEGEELIEETDLIFQKEAQEQKAIEIKESWAEEKVSNKKQKATSSLKKNEIRNSKKKKAFQTKNLNNNSNNSNEGDLQKIENKLDVNIDDFDSIFQHENINPIKKERKRMRVVDSEDENE